MAISTAEPVAADAREPQRRVGLWLLMVGLVVMLGGQPASAAWAWVVTSSTHRGHTSGG
jgi:hypothetical protein